MNNCIKVNNLSKMCDCLNGQKQIEYKKVKTEGNDPTISKAMQFSAYIKNSRSRNIMYAQYHQSLNK